MNDILKEQFNNFTNNQIFGLTESAMMPLSHIINCFRQQSKGNEWTAKQVTINLMDAIYYDNSEAYKETWASFHTFGLKYLKEIHGGTDIYCYVKDIAKYHYHIEQVKLNDFTIKDYDQVWINFIIENTYYNLQKIYTNSKLIINDNNEPCLIVKLK